MELCNHNEINCKKTCINLEQGEDCNVKPELTMEIKTISGKTPEISTPMNATATVDSPVFHFVDLTNISDAINYQTIFIFSDTNSCGTVSIHPMKCPVPDGYGETVETDVLNSWKHMYKTGVLTLNTDKYKAKSGFFIKLPLIQQIACVTSHVKQQT